MKLNFSNTVSKKDKSSEIDIQRYYYKKTADDYEEMHFSQKDEHYFALQFLSSIIEFYEIKTILDVGAGTGRVGRYLKSRNPDVKVTSIEPVQALREVGHRHGLSEEELLDGDATALNYADETFDLVCEFAILHHVKNPEKVVREMIRVGRIGIFISDCNNFGQGTLLNRTIKQAINTLKLWRLFDFVKTRGKGYTLSDGDGLAYSYSIFNDYALIKKHCSTYVLNTVNAGINPYRTAAHAAILGIKNEVAGS